MITDEEGTWWDSFEFGILARSRQEALPWYVDIREFICFRELWQRFHSKKDARYHLKLRELVIDISYTLIYCIDPTSFLQFMRVLEQL